MDLDTKVERIKVAFKKFFDDGRHNVEWTGWGTEARPCVLVSAVFSLDDLAEVLADAVED